jgi:hypothetical protein
MFDAFRHYGLAQVSEENMSDEQKKVRRCKVEIIDNCERMRKLINQVERRAKGIPENGDFDMARHLSLVKRWEGKVKDVNNLLEETTTYGIT